MKRMKREDFIEWSIQASLDCEEMERQAQAKMKKPRLLELAEVMGVEVRDGWYNVSNIATVDGSPWVCEQEFLEIVKDLLDE